VSVAAGVQVVDVPQRERFEVLVDGAVAGFAAYRLKPGLIAFIHTEIDEAMEGKGLAGTLIEFALQDARRRDLAVLPFCPFVNAYIASHPQYADLVPSDFRERFGL